MMESLNRFATEYAGLLAIVGLALGGMSAVAAVYFYYNPRQSQYRLSYKIFSRGFISNGIRRIGNALKREEDRSFPIFVDLWNAGAEPISNDVMREPITLALQSSVVSRGVQVRKAEVVRESHSGVSGFEVKLDGAVAHLVWNHFDPGMAVRVRMETSEPLSGDQMAVFGKGLRLTFKRIRNLSDVGGILGAIKNATVIAIPAAGCVALGGQAVHWISLQAVYGLMSYLYFVAAFIALVLLLGVCIALGFAINSLSEWAFNTRSPIEKIEGEPSFRFGSEEERLAFIEEQRADIAFRYDKKRSVVVTQSGGDIF